MSKKILSVVLALALVCSCFAVSAFAVGGMGYEDDATAYTQTWELQTPVQNGTTWTVDVKLTTTAPEGEVYKVGSMQFKVLGYQDTAITLDSFTASSAIPENWLADTKASNDTGKVIINPNPTEDAVDGIDCAEGVIIGTLTFTVPEDASATINIEDVEKTAANPAGSLIAARMSDGNVVTGTSIVGQDATVGADQNLGAVAVVTPELKVIAGKPGKINTEQTFKIAEDGDVAAVTCDGYIYGIDAYDLEEEVADVFYVENGSMNIRPSVGGSTKGTGAVIEVRDSKDVVVKEYVLIVFGDLTGDGVIDTEDVGMSQAGFMWTIENSNYAYPDGYLHTYLEFAGDITGDGVVDTDDVGLIQAGFMWTLGDMYGTADSLFDISKLVDLH